MSNITVAERSTLDRVGQVVYLSDKLLVLQLGSGGFLVLVLLGNVVTELAESDDLADRRVGRRRNFDDIEPEALRFAQGVGKFHHAQLFASGS